jgi:hypothetical protein
MIKAELFNIETKKDDQRKAEMAMTPAQRLLLCLDLMDMHIMVKQNSYPETPEADENIRWINLRLKHD